jgi:hypothetical protein
MWNIKLDLCISGFEATILMQTVRKYLLYEYVPIVGKTFRSGTGESCVAQRSIYVILGGNEETRRYINQVRNVMRYLMSVILYECNLIERTKYRTSLFVLLFHEPPEKQDLYAGWKVMESQLSNIFVINSQFFKLTSAMSQHKGIFILQGHNNLPIC